MKLTKDAAADKCEYSGYGIGPDARLRLSLSNGKWDKNILVLEGPIDGLENTTIKAEAKYSINITISKKGNLLKSALLWKQ